MARVGIDYTQIAAHSLLDFIVKAEMFSNRDVTRLDRLIRGLLRDEDDEPTRQLLLAAVRFLETL